MDDRTKHCLSEADSVSASQIVPSSLFSLETDPELDKVQFGITAAGSIMRSLGAEDPIVVRVFSPETGSIATAVLTKKSRSDTCVKLSAPREKAQPRSAPNMDRVYGAMRASKSD